MSFWDALERRYDAAEARVVAVLSRIRRRYGWFDHLARAVLRYTSVNGSRLAAALTYNGFLALFPVLLLAFSIFGFVLQGNEGAMAHVTNYLATNLPLVKAGSIADARLTTGLIGVVGVLFTGLTWVQEIRGSVRLMWRKREEPERHLVVATLVDVVVMVALGLVILLSMLITFTLTGGVRWALEHLGLPHGDGGVMVRVASLGIGVFVGVALFMSLLSGVPRLKMGFSRLFWPSLIGAVGFELLKLSAQLVLRFVVDNPAYAVVATAAGLLLFFNLLNRLLLFCAALTATAESGEVVQKPAPTWRNLFSRAAKAALPRTIRRR